MQKPGYIYALTNPSLPGMIKIGSTLRDPRIRTAELSSATGVPTPFIIAHKEYVSDAPSAELYVHILLEERGFRVAANREFFETGLKDVILAMQDAKKHVGIENSQDKSQFIVNEDKYDEAYFMAEDLLGKARSLLYEGSLGVQDQDEAVRLLKQAVKLGNDWACSELGALLRTDYVASKQATSTYKLNDIEALKYFKLAVERRLAVCYSDMAEIYEQHAEFLNALNCWSKYFDAVSTDILAEYPHDYVFRYIHLAWMLEAPIRHKDKLITLLRSEKYVHSDQIIIALYKWDNWDGKNFAELFLSQWWHDLLDQYFAFSDQDIKYRIEAADVERGSSYNVSAIEVKQEQPTGCLVIVGSFVFIGYGLFGVSNFLS